MLRRAAVVSVVGFLLGGFPASTHPQLLDHAAKARLRWIVAGYQLGPMSRDDATLARYFFGRRVSYVIGKASGTQNQVPRDYRAIATLKYKSFLQFKRDAYSHRIDRAVRAVIYDPENWGDTPAAEKEDPSRYLRLFASLARRLGYYAITSPGRDLVTAPGAACRRRPREGTGAAFLRCRIPAAAARYANAFKVQAQIYENDPAKYRSFVQAAMRQARAANPKVLVLSNLATSPGDYVATADMLWAAHQAVARLVAGHQLNWNSEELGIAKEFLLRARAAGT
jgi:hypothetical protein